MKADVASYRYRARHLEPDLPIPPQSARRWRHVLVVPAYREDPGLLDSLHALGRSTREMLAIVVINRPDSDADRSANAGLRRATRALPPMPGGEDLYQLAGGNGLLVWDTESRRGPLPANRGVGLARKIGCDIAWRWIDQGLINSRWIHCTDGDARLPQDYFRRTEVVTGGVAAATYPFIHTPGKDPDCNRATALYELRLHHYVLGLEYARSPYAYHSLGSSLAVAADAYAKVRGFPQRAAGEDFYLLNKLAKVGVIERLRGACIELESRVSHRVPFGTGPAVARLRGGDPSQPLFYHPRSFLALRALLQVVDRHTVEAGADLRAQLGSQGLDSRLSAACEQVLTAMGWQRALEHCARHSADEAQFRRHFHQWFDAFRTLKFIHGLRGHALPQQTLAALATLTPDLWPAHPPGEAVLAHWGWSTPDPARW